MIAIAIFDACLNLVRWMLRVLGKFIVIIIASFLVSHFFIYKLVLVILLHDFINIYQKPILTLFYELLLASSSELRGLSFIFDANSQGLFCLSMIL